MQAVSSSKDLRKQMDADVQRLKRKAREWFDTKPKLWGYPTGLERMDALTGGLAPNELIVLAGGPGSGKTSLAMQMVEASAQWLLDNDPGRVNLVISAEMTRASLMQRMACKNSGIDLSALRRGQISETDLARYNAALEAIYKLPILVADAPGMTSEHVRALVDLLMDEGLNLGVVAIDYIQQLFDEGQETQRINLIVRNLVYLKQQTDCSVLALSQYSRGKLKENRPPQPEDLLGSGNIERAADRIYGLHNVDVPEHEKHRGLVPVELYVLKNRNGPRGKLHLEFDAAATVFREPGTSRIKESIPA